MKLTIMIDADSKELALEYLENRRIELPRLKEFVAALDYKNISDLAHKMKGNGKTYGYQEFTDLGGALEKAARGGDENECRKIVGQIEFFISNVEIKFTSVA